MNLTESPSKHQISLFPLIMLAIVSVDSLRNLPISAQYGFSLISFYIVAAIAFFFPLAWIASQLATRYPNTGGSYIWIEKAFGQTFGYLSIWLQWLYNMIWYPTIFVFITVTFASFVTPHLENNKWFILLTSLGLFWLITYLHGFGIRTINWLSTAGAIVGTLVPMFLLISLACYWLLAGMPSATPFTWGAILPDAHSMANLAFFSNILFSLLGLEVIGMHAGNVKQPQKTYPKALAISAALILVTLIGSSLSLCIILPAKDIALISGLMNVFGKFFEYYDFPKGTYIIGFCILFGGLAIASSWMIGLARGLHIALCSMRHQRWIQHLNQNHMPSRVLLLQAIIYSILLGVFLFFPNLDSSYWVLSALTAQFALLYYLVLFCAAYKLLRNVSLNKHANALNKVLPIFACAICLFGIVIGFIPPAEVESSRLIYYEVFMLLGFVGLGLIPVIVTKKLKNI